MPRLAIAPFHPSMGDVLVIDDRATMLRAHGDYDRRQSRVLWRIIVEGDRPRLD